MLRCQCLSVCLSVMEVNWYTIANLRFKFQSKFTVHCRCGEGSSQQQHLALYLPQLGPLVYIVILMYCVKFLLFTINKKPFNMHFLTHG